MHSISTPGELLDNALEQVERARNRNETLELLIKSAALLALIGAALIAAVILARLSTGNLIPF